MGWYEKLTEQIPWVEHPIDYDVRAKPRNIGSLTGTKDLQMVSAFKVVGR